MGAAGGGGGGGHLKLLLESVDRRCPLFELEVLLLNILLKVYDHLHALVQHLVSDI
jgi:hypothetical protein